RTPEENSLWKLIHVSYQVLNATYPNLTEHCWLCYGIKPPFYEAVGVTMKGRRINETNPAHCLWKSETRQKQEITMARVTGKGKYVG
ncbi:ENV2 protein, partial [Atrichornis clamosus]|nr:ENV2 protein [Atrichornis clamosus]